MKPAFFSFTWKKGQNQKGDLRTMERRQFSWQCLLFRHHSGTIGPLAQLKLPCVSPIKISGFVHVFTEKPLKQWIMNTSRKVIVRCTVIYWCNQSISPGSHHKRAVASLMQTRCLCKVSMTPSVHSLSA